MNLVTIVFTVEISISPRMQRVLLLMNLILGFCRPRRQEDHKNDVWQNVVYTFMCTVDDMLHRIC